MKFIMILFYNLFFTLAPSCKTFFPILSFQNFSNSSEIEYERFVFGQNKEI